MNPTSRLPQSALKLTFKTTPHRSKLWFLFCCFEFHFLFPPWNFIGNPPPPLFCLLPLTFAPYQVSDDVKRSALRLRGRRRPHAPAYLSRFEERAPFTLWKTCAAHLSFTGSNEKKPPSQRASWDSPTHLWFINWWFITQRHIGNANVSTVVLFSPDVRHGGTAVQGLLGFVNPVAASVKVGFPV